jgi:hypothetical protein
MGDWFDTLCGVILICVELLGIYMFIDIVISCMTDPVF